MKKSYRRFKEIRENVHAKLNSHKDIEGQLTDAVCELSLLHITEIPKYKQETVKEILETCSTHQAEGDEGIFNASISRMTYTKQIELKRTIETI